MTLKLTQAEIEEAKKEIIWMSGFLLSAFIISDDDNLKTLIKSLNASFNNLRIIFKLVEVEKKVNEE